MPAPQAIQGIEKNINNAFAHFPFGSLLKFLVVVLMLLSAERCNIYAVMTGAWW